MNEFQTFLSVFGMGSKMTCEHKIYIITLVVRFICSSSKISVMLVYAYSYTSASANYILVALTTRIIAREKNSFEYRLNVS